MTCFPVEFMSDTFVKIVELESVNNSNQPRPNIVSPLHPDKAREKGVNTATDILYHKLTGTIKQLNIMVVICRNLEMTNNNNNNK